MKKRNAANAKARGSSQTQGSRAGKVQSPIGLVQKAVGRIHKVAGEIVVGIVWVGARSGSKPEIWLRYQ